MKTELIDKPAERAARESSNASYLLGLLHGVIGGVIIWDVFHWVLTCLE